MQMYKLHVRTAVIYTFVSMQCMYIYIHQILDAAYSIMLLPMMSGLTVAATKGTVVFRPLTQMQLDVSKSGTKKTFSKETKI